MMFFKMQMFWFWGLLIIFCAETKNFLSPLAFSCLRFDMFFWLSHWKINQTCMILKRSAVCLLPSANREKKMASNAQLIGQVTWIFIFVHQNLQFSPKMWYRLWLHFKEDLSVFVRYYPDKNFESQLSADKKILVKVRALVTLG